MAPAAADGPAEPDVVRAIPAGELTGLERARGPERQRLQEVRDEFLADHAAAGRFHDKSEVTAVIDPVTGASATHLPGVALDALHVQEVHGEDGRVVATALGAESRPVEVPQDTDSGQGMGWAPNPTPTGYRLDDSGSLKLRTSHDPDIDADYSSNDHFVETWWWKYELPEWRESEAFTSNLRSGSDFWVYTRHGSADGANNSYQLNDLTIRSRPWGTTDDRIRQYLDVLPKAGDSTCTTAGTLSVSYGGLGVSIPVSNCQSTQGVNNTSHPLEFGTDWDGGTTNKIGVEALASIRTHGGQVPVMADYIWAEFWGCGWTTCDVDYIKWTDTGW